MCNYHWQLTCDHHTWPVTDNHHTVHLVTRRLECVHHTSGDTETTSITRLKVTVVTNNMQPTITHYLSGDTDWDKCDHHTSCYWQRATITTVPRQSGFCFSLWHTSLASTEQPGRVGARSGGGRSVDIFGRSQDRLKHPVLSERTVLFCKWFQAMTFLVSVKVRPSHVWRLTKPRDHHTSGD